ncbi:MarR family winged helix-turn-helix transcriptional regulator [Nocardia sp. NPDC058176]|uniref:MarR family winged helix-turn-helix transcriptional regulator n=1 Tax=Nocardia sp. NPDC058176 TaxID=3346368 RepID=UPI0036DC1701
MAEPRMIGYQVKRLDQLIEATFDRATEAAGMSRREWQVLNTIVRAPATTAELWDALRPFWDDESVTDPRARGVGQGDHRVVDVLIDRGWIVRDDRERLVPTTVGAAAHEHAARSVGAIRRQLADGITDTEFAALTETLARMIANLESTH